MAYSIKTTFNGIEVDCKFDKQVNILRGYSGTGKTMLLGAIEQYCIRNGIKCAYTNDKYEGEDSDVISHCKKAKIVLLDNADLYITNDIMNRVRETAELIIISIKNPAIIDISDGDMFRVEYKSRHAMLRR